jgi:hypothetical protein
MPSALFALLIFHIRSHVYSQASLDYNPIYVSHTARVTGVCHHAQLFLLGEV